MFKDIFTYDDVIDCSDDFVCFGGVEFLKDFGPFVKGDKLEALYVSYDKASFTEQDEDGDDKERSCQFTIQPVA